MKRYDTQPGTAATAPNPSDHLPQASPTCNERLKDESEHLGGLCAPEQLVIFIFPRSDLTQRGDVPLARVRDAVAERHEGHGHGVNRCQQHVDQDARQTAVAIGEGVTLKEVQRGPSCQLGDILYFACVHVADFARTHSCALHHPRR